MITEMPGTPAELEERVEALTERERIILQELGRAVLQDLPTRSRRSELTEVRDELEAVYSALRIVRRGGLR